MVLYNNWHGLALFGMSFFAGIRIFNDPLLFQMFSSLGFGEGLMLQFILQYRIVGLCLIIPSLVKLYGIIMNKVIFRRVSNIALFVVWTLTFFSFIASTPPNLLGVLSATGSFSAFGLLLKESANNE